LYFLYFLPFVKTNALAALLFSPLQALHLNALNTPEALAWPWAKIAPSQTLLPARVLAPNLLFLGD
jgi:hypothetical protein